MEFSPFNLHQELQEIGNQLRAMNSSLAQSRAESANARLMMRNVHVQPQVLRPLQKTVGVFIKTSISRSRSHCLDRLLGMVWHLLL